MTGFSNSERRDAPRTRVQKIMTLAAELQVRSPAHKASEALELPARHGANQLPVMKGGGLLGMVTWEDLLGWLNLGRDAA